MGITADKMDEFIRNPLAFTEGDVAALFKDGETAESDKGDQGEGNKGETEAKTPAATADEASKEAPKQGDKPAASSEPDPQNTVIATKDGKHTIPYSVLQQEREQKARLERALREANEKVANLQAQAEGGVKDLTPEVERLTPDELKEMEAEAPTIAKALRSMYAQMDAMQGTVKTVEQERQANTNSAVQEAIESIPKLVHVQANDADTFNAIAEIDAWMREQPKYQGLSLQQRFEKAVSMYEAANGAIQLPGASAKAEKQEDVSAKAAAAIKAAEEKAEPDTLSHLPGGNPPPKSELESAADLSAAQLTNMFMNMDPKKIDAYLARLAT